ncbi:MAG: FliG C-terminal domain-containing protein, partial [Planctomycetota bacterium]
VLLFLDGEQSAEVLKLLPEETRPEIVMRIANVDSINPDILGELDDLLKKQVTDVPTRSVASVDGVRLAAQILTHLDSSSEGAILDGLEQIDEEVCEEIREKMFIFENLMVLDDRDRTGVPQHRPGVYVRSNC